MAMPPPPPRFAAPAPVNVPAKRPPPPPNFDGTPSGQAEGPAKPAGTEQAPAEAKGIPVVAAAPGTSDGQARKSRGDAPARQPDGEPDGRESNDAAKAKSVPEYTPPSWSAPAGVEYKLEVLKMGSVVEEIDVTAQPFYTFGRHPSCNFMLEHPSCSRLHAVIQFRDTGEAFLWDAGSTHGTFMNKRRLKANVFAPLRVGDQFKCGQSSRIYILAGPQELLPEEGLSRAEKMQLKKLEAMAAAQEEAAVRQMEVAKAMMRQRESSGATWGQDTSEAEDFSQVVRTGEAFDWKSYSGKLNERQEKLKEKLHKKDQTVQNLRAEIQRIQAKKDAQEGGLSQGQEMQVARNEQRIEQLEEEMDMLAEQFEESVMDGAMKRAGGDAAAQKRKKAPAEEEEEFDSDSDEFYDRTGVKHKRTKVVIATEAPKQEKKAETIDSLWEKHKKAQADRAELLAKLEAVEAAERRDQELEERAAAQAAQGESDALDAFMTTVSHNLDRDTVASLRAAAAEADGQIARLERLMKLADPTGQYKGPKAPKAKPAAAPPSDEKRQAAAAAAAAAAAVVAAVAAPSVGAGSGSGAGSGRNAFADEDESREASAAAAAAGPDESGFLNPEALKALIAKEKAAGGGGFRAPSAVAGAAGRGGGLQGPPSRAGHLGKRERPKSDAELAAAAEAKVSADLQMLLGGGGRGHVDDEDEGLRTGGEWAPPEGQRGDGKTSLNERLGY